MKKVKGVKGYGALWLVALVAVAVALLRGESHLLWKIQELDLFLWTPLFFEQQMVVPAGMLSWLGAGFTQLLYQPWLGVLVLCGWWWLLMWLLKRTFCISDRWALLALIPVALLLMANVDMGYWIYLQKLRGWFFSATIGVTVATALLWVFRSMPDWHCGRQVLIALVALAGYPLLGAYALAAVVLMGLWAWRIEKNRWMAAADTVVAVVGAVGVPLLCYRYVYYETHVANIYWAGLSDFHLMETSYYHLIPFYLLAVYYLLLALLCGKGRQREADKQRSTEGRSDGRSRLMAWLVQGVLAVVLVVGIATVWYKDENYHHELAMMHAVEQLRWEEVLEEASRQKDEPTRVIVMLRNLALSRLGRQGDEMYFYPNGSKAADADFTVQASLLVGNMIYYHYGLLNDCHHVCIELGVKFGWGVSELKYMARSSMLMGDIKAMRKATGLLKHTLYHRQWAEKLEQLQRDGQQQMSSHPETGPILHMLHYPDTTGPDSGNNVEKTLMGILARMDAPDETMQEQCLLAALWQKEARLFWPRFTRYVAMRQQGAIPRHYLEAACLFAHEGQQQATDLHFPYGKEVEERYERFMQELAAYDGMELLDVQQALYPLYGDTYYYEYYLMNNLEFF